MKKAKIFKIIAIIAFVLLVLSTITYFISTKTNAFAINDINFAKVYKTLFIIILLFSSFSASAKMKAKEKKD
ncbi:hypothetical protein [Peptoniphilus stercorisuis]|uniref:Uncharacterized protein n=1 Tax=Peptoniphilus stercorisuis TaxID=1436965 RepID=A0ABS4KE59_9FIRM|nr:hypothetical protein [Peptoniphilus stercorisuis]MBP2025680.1 hypothetical protein [Peptoniphilus stercorisuis]